MACNVISLLRLFQRSLNDKLIQRRACQVGSLLQLLCDRTGNKVSDPAPGVRRCHFIYLSPFAPEGANRL